MKTATTADLFLDGTAQREATSAARREVPVNPKLPKHFDSTPNASRPQSHKRWWYQPYVVTETWEQRDQPDSEKNEERKRGWFEAWPGGTRYDVRCLDGGAWDRSTWWGAFATLEEAIACAQRGPNWRRGQ